MSDLDVKGSVIIYSYAAIYVFATLTQIIFEKESFLRLFCRLVLYIVRECKVIPCCTVASENLNRVFICYVTINCNMLYSIVLL